MKLNINDNKKFSIKSGDKNKIHIDTNHAKNFFIKKPIVHGANILIRMCKQKKFFKKKFDYLGVFFKDFININEKFTVQSNNNKVIIKGLYNTKIEIIKKNYQKKEFIKKKYLIDEFFFISKYIGNISPGPNSLIQQIKIRYSKKFFNKRILKKRNINRNVQIISYFHKNIITEIIAIKLKPYREKSENKFPVNKKIIRLLKNKKILIYGKNSDLGNFIYNSNLKNFCKIDLLSSKTLDSYSLNNNLRKIKPDFIFYFLSPKIINGNSKKINKNYSNIYINIPKKIFNVASKYKEKFKIFYPSTIFINEQKKYKYLKSYIDAKKRGEIEFKKNIYKKFFFITRLPQLKTRSNYDPFLAKYSGKKLDFVSNKILEFFK